jgi:hypothetical protein
MEFEAPRSDRLAGSFFRPECRSIHEGRSPKADCPGPSWGREPAVSGGQARCPADSHNRS